MDILEMSFFLVQAKRATYAAGMPSSGSSRPASVDLPYRSGDWLYIDSYFGAQRFIGEEAVYHATQTGGVSEIWQALWGMNYYGWMMVEEAPTGFSPFLKSALSLASEQAPFRGPADIEEADFHYRCRWQGTLERFEGNETIYWRRKPVYRLLFHGGLVG